MFTNREFVIDFHSKPSSKMVLQQVIRLNILSDSDRK